MEYTALCTKLLFVRSQSTIVWLKQGNGVKGAGKKGSRKRVFSFVVNWCPFRRTCRETLQRCIKLVGFLLTNSRKPYFQHFLLDIFNLKEMILISYYSLCDLLGAYSCLNLHSYAPKPTRRLLCTPGPFHLH